MEKELGQEYKNPIQREAFLKDNCDACENKGYMKPYTPEELQGHKENLANVSIEIEELENKKKEQYILQYKLGNKQFLQDYEKYFDSSYEEEQDRVVNLYYNMLINEEDSIEEIR